MDTVSGSKKEKRLRKIFFRTAKLPLIFFLISIFCLSLAYIEPYFSNLALIFEFIEKLSNIFIALAVVTFFYNICITSCRAYENKLMQRHAVAALILSSVRKALRIIFLLITLNLVILLMGPNKFYLIVANNLLNILIIGFIGWIAIQILYTIEAVTYQYMVALTRQENIKVKALYTKLHIIRNIGSVLIFIITLAAILMSFPSVRNVGVSILASAGFLTAVITAVIGLSSQKTLSSLFSGLQIALSQIIKIGDTVVIDNYSGTIEEITFTYVALKLGDRRNLIVPINLFVEKTFENCSRDNDGLGASIRLFVDFMLPIDPLRQELKRIMHASSYWDHNTCKLEVANFGDRSIELRIQISASDADNLSHLRTVVQEGILDFIRQKYPDHFPKVRLNAPRQKFIEK